MNEYRVGCPVFYFPISHLHLYAQMYVCDTHVAKGGMLVTALRIPLAATDGDLHAA